MRDLKRAAQGALKQLFLRPVGPDGHLLDPTDSLEAAGLRDGDHLMAIARQPKVAATSKAFALWCLGESTLWAK